MSELEQWAIEQHLKKYPKCEWICTHTSKENLGEKLGMEIYKPFTTPNTIDKSLCGVCGTMTHTTEANYCIKCGCLKPA